MSSNVAHVCLRSWNLILGSPALSSSGRNDRLVRFWASRGVPTREANTKLVVDALEMALWSRG